MYIYVYIEIRLIELCNIYQIVLHMRDMIFLLINTSFLDAETWANQSKMWNRQEKESVKGHSFGKKLKGQAIRPSQNLKIRIAACQKTKKDNLREPLRIRAPACQKIRGKVCMISEEIFWKNERILLANLVSEV